ncbi:MAG: single-stranded DNA-binding protein [Eubacteriaceae bacterium]|jgi:single-strand DNA-binding protein|nr:single-stranded DNA-binding protein [Eubacteriaceae bacterium]
MNSVQLIGRLTRDPEVRYTESNMAIATFTIAIDRPPRQDGTREADFPRITVFGRQAETVQRYLAKGRQVAVEGRIQTGSYTNKNGDKVYTTDVVANRVEFLGGRNDNAGAPSGGQPVQESRSAAPQQPAAVPPEFQEIPDDDIPF